MFCDQWPSKITINNNKKMSSEQYVNETLLITACDHLPKISSFILDVSGYSRH